MLTALLALIAAGLIASTILLGLILWRLLRPLPPNTAAWLLRFTLLESNTTKVVVGIAEDVAGMNARLDQLIAEVKALGTLPPEQLHAMRQIVTEPQFRAEVRRNFAVVGALLTGILLVLVLLAVEHLGGGPALLGLR